MIYIKTTMTKLSLAILSLIMISSAADARMTKGYFKKSGTYVSPSFKTKPNRTKWDNYSTKGNTNPYTGSKGYASPYKK